MKKATLNQAAKILSIFENTPAEQIQEILSSGLLADLRDGNITNVDRDEFRKILGLIPKDQAMDYLIWWRSFYRKEGIEINIDSFEIPKKSEGHWRLIVVAPGMTYERVIKVMRKKFKVSFHCNFDPVIDLNREQRRAIDEPYAVWVKGCTEADSNLKNKAACDLLGVNMSLITFLERCLLEIIFFSFISVGNHLDIQNKTLCAGSHYLNEAAIPDFGFEGGQVCISWTGAAYNGDKVRCRQVFA